MVTTCNQPLIHGVSSMLVSGLVACCQVFADDSETTRVSLGGELGMLNEVDVGQGNLYAQGHLQMALGHHGYVSARDGYVSAFDQNLDLNNEQYDTLSPNNERYDTLSLSGEAGYEDLVNFELRSDFLDLLELGSSEQEDPDFAFIQAGGLWEENAVGDTEITLSSLNDRLSFTWRQAWSSYNASESYLEDLEGSEELEGNARLYRADAILWDAGERNLSVFAQQSEVDPFFESVGLSEDDESGGFADNEDPFAISNRETARVGTTVGFGPMQVTLHRDTVRMVESFDDDEASGGDHELRQGISAWIDLYYLRSLAGEVFQDGIWDWTPNSVWVDVSNGRVESPEPGDSPDAADDISFGTSWSWNSAYADVSFWRSVYDSRGPWVDDYDYAGHGADLSVGFYGSNWNVDTSFGLNRSENLETAARGVDSSLEGGLSVMLRPEILPDFSGSLFVGRYGYDYLVYDTLNRLAYDEASRSDYWQLGVDLDFSKFLADLTATLQPNLKMIYRFGNAPMQVESSDTRSEIDNFVAVLFELKL